VKHYADPAFWKALVALPPKIRAIAEKNFELLKSDPRHPSLRFKRVGPYWSSRVGIDYRAVAVPDGENLIWFWIGTHAEYDRVIGKR
jgi:hypothetical protein